MNHTVVKTVNAEDEMTGDAYELFAFEKVRGNHGEIRLPRNEARDIRKVVDLLIRKNWNVPTGKRAAETIVERAISAEPHQYEIFAARLGWRNRFRSFVLTDRVVARQGRRPRVRPPLWLNANQQLQI